MECPKCQANVYKKIKDSKGVEYYRCSNCHHENHHFRILWDKMLKKSKE